MCTRWERRQGSRTAFEAHADCSARRCTMLRRAEMPFIISQIQRPPHGKWRGRLGQAAGW